ncbi:MAG: hypothetical protein CMD08_02255 [Flavobacteriales bacterium]|nr:hypothetical protein [Flavobacteriales bacterium]|tara:strand:- start:179 stop:613 length:435 start_codon:yes stop_codon:yes gene_type:complete
MNCPRLLCLLITVIAYIFPLSGQIVINEYTAANYDSHDDNYGEDEDWIGLYNTSSSGIDINGWFLTDRPTNPTKWTVPNSFIVPANGFAIIYCYGGNELVGGTVHTIKPKANCLRGHMFIKYISKIMRDGNTKKHLNFLLSAKN